MGGVSGGVGAGRAGARRAAPAGTVVGPHILLIRPYVMARYQVLQQLVLRVVVTCQLKLQQVRK